MDVSKKITDLWLHCFEGIDKSFVKSFYGSFECEGNIIIAHVRDGELKITRGMQNAVKPVGIVNRVPCQLHIGRNTVNGYYLYGCCVEEEWRGRGVFRALIDNANCDSSFTVLVPEKEELIGLYEKLGYSLTEGSIFPFECGAEVLDGIETVEADEDYSSLLALDAARNGDGFTFGGIFNSFIMKTLRDKKLSYIMSDGAAVGYVIYERISDDTVRVYDMYSRTGIVSDIVSGYGIEKKAKSMIRISGSCEKLYPALNRCGEY